MSQPNQAILSPIEPTPIARRPYISADLTYETMSDLGRELFDLSQEIAASGEGLASEVEFERELLERKGGYVADERA